jgi:hypothetical protein
LGCPVTYWFERRLPLESSKPPFEVCAVEQEEVIAMQARKIGRLTAAALITVIALAVVPATFGAWSSPYWGPASMSPVQIGNTGWNYWDNNRVYRNTGWTISLWYTNSSGDVGYKANSTVNPFALDSGAFGYSVAKCGNTNATLNPVTCEVHI